MKWNTCITMKKSIVVAATVALLSTAPQVLADWLDVIAENITVTNARTGQSGTTVTAQAGDTLNIVCTEWIGLSSGHDIWETKTVQRWENRVTINGQSVAIFNPTIAAGTIIGSSQSSSGFLGLGGSKSKKGFADIRNTYPPVAWTASGTGSHEVRCVLNQPKQISDHVLTNNVAAALVVVQAPPQTTAANPSAPTRPPTVIGAASDATPAAAQRSAGPVGSGSGGARVTAATGIRALNSQQSAAEAPPNPCHMDVSYYVPLPPVVESSSPSLQVGDQVQVQCTFEKRMRQMEWPQCDDAAKGEMQSLKNSQESGSRYSGMMIIDDANVGVATSPPDGSSFDNTGTWLFHETGSHEVTCQVDNGLYVAGGERPLYLEAGATLSVGSRSDDAEFRAFDPAAARRINTSIQASRTESVANDSRIGISEPSRTGRGGDELVNPSLNPQPEVPSPRQAGGDDIVNPSLNPQPEVPSKRQERDGATSPQPTPMPDPPSPNLDNNAPENFTGAAGKDSEPAFDPRKEFATVRTAQGRVAMSEDLNDISIAPLVIEAESLIATAVASGGQMVRQEMAGFGTGWGGNAQLFWRPPTPAGSKPHMLTEFELSAAGTYDLILHYTTAPDFGQFTVYIDGSNPSLQDGYGPEVALRQVSLGRYPLAAGRHELAFEVTGKNRQSTAYIVGVDRLQLIAVP